jgi:glutaredoxin
MKNKLQIYFLQGCDRCKKLKATLDSLKIKYDAVPCEEYPNMCDNMENITGVNSYPMVKLDSIIYYVSDDYANIGKPKTVANKLKTIGTHSIDNIIDAIKNY